MRLATVVGAIAAAGTLVVGAKVPGATPSSQTPTFRSGVELVRLDVSVLDNQRRPVTGLVAADFTVLEDGKPRPVVSFAPVELAAPALGTAAWVHDVAPDIATNAQVPGGRLVVILLDRSIALGQPTMAALEVARAAVRELGPNDQAAVISTAFGAPQNFTSDRARLLRAIDRLSPSTEPSADASGLSTSLTVDELQATSQAGVIQAGQCYCGTCVPETIAHVADTVRDIPRRKSLLFIGSSVPLQSGDADCGFRNRNATQKMMRALDLANLTVHSFDPTGLENWTGFGRASSPARATPADRVRAIGQTTIGPALDRQNSLGVLPDRTGGRTVVNSNTPQNAVKAVFQESAAYYLVAFEAADPTPGKLHDVEVRTRRKDLKVLAQRRFVVEAEPRANVGPLAGAVGASLARATAGVSPKTELPLAVVVMPFATTDMSSAVVFVVTGMTYPVAPVAGSGGVATSSLPGQQREEIGIVATAYDRYARPQGFDQRALSFPHPSDWNGVVPLEALARLSLRPGSYEIRVAASSLDGSPAGSVFTYVDVPSFASAPLTLSGLALDVDPAVPGVAADVANDLPVRPTARRSFTRGDRVAAFLRVYQGGREVVVPVALTIRLTTAEGAVALDRSISLSPDQFSSRAADFRTALPLTNLNAGEHLLSIDAQLGERTVSRQLRFTMLPGGGAR